MARALYAAMLFASAVSASSSPADAAAGLAERLLGSAASTKLSFELLPSCPQSAPRCARVENGSSNGTLKISGSSAVEMAFALGQFLRKHCLMSFSWAKTGGHQLKEGVCRASDAGGWPELEKPMILNQRTLSLIHI